MFPTPNDSLAWPELAAYRCPMSGTPLTSDGSRLRNQDGAAVADINSGVVSFATRSQEEDGPTLQTLSTLNAIARAKGWRDALTSVYGAAFVGYVTSPERRGFIDLLPITKESRVLEIGPGLGQFTASLAEKARVVHALEVVQGQAEFTAERMRQTGAQNVQVAAGGSDCRLPYADQTFDLVVLSLVFEWCAARATESHEAVQQRLLAEMHRVLRPGGSLYLATKNRYGVSYLFGRADEHFEGMRFGSCLPRRVSAWLHGKRQPGYLHSYRGLQRMFGQAGFRTAKSWWALPDYRFPARLVETDVQNVRAARGAERRLGRSRLENIVLRMAPAACVRHVMPGLNFLVKKQA